MLCARSTGASAAVTPFVQIGSRPGSHFLDRVAGQAAFFRTALHATATPTPAVPERSKIKGFPRKPGCGTRHCGGMDGYGEAGSQWEVAGDGNEADGACGGCADWTDVQTFLYRWESSPVRGGRMGTAHGADRERKRRDDLPPGKRRSAEGVVADGHEHRRQQVFPRETGNTRKRRLRETDRKSTRLNSSHGYISYAVFCF